MTSKQFSIGSLCIACIALSMTACTNTQNSVIAVTGTTIGVEISQAQPNQTPQGVLGYKRAELAYVPTNKAQTRTTTTTLDGNGKPTQTVTTEKPYATGGGAADSTDVLMELKYSGIFLWGSGSGIYQRLAVGKNAVSQNGAAYMFSRDSEGKLDEKAAQYITGGQKLNDAYVQAADRVIIHVSTGAPPTLDNGKLAALIVKAKTLDTKNQYKDGFDHIAKSTDLVILKKNLELLPESSDLMSKSIP